MNAEDRQKLQATADKADKAAMKKYAEWATDDEEAEDAFLIVCDAIYFGWRELTNRTAPLPDDGIDVDAQDFENDKDAQAVLAPFVEKYRYQRNH